MLWVQPDGSLASDTAWQSQADWETVTIRGLVQNAGYTFRAKARNVPGVQTIMSPAGSALSTRTAVDAAWALYD
jgi:hypothetical protein